LAGAYDNPQCALCIDGEWGLFSSSLAQGDAPTGRLLDAEFAMDGLAQLGMVLDILSEDHPPLHVSEGECKDYFVEKDGMKYAGMHLLVDLWGARDLSNPNWIDKALRDAAATAGATILHSHFHHFSPNGGVSGILVLAESHISIHTWPERDFAAVDVFMCGACDPRKAIPVLCQAFRPERVDVEEQRRGRVF
jgi:S-adenosylmethionine decarboxylase